MLLDITNLTLVSISSSNTFDELRAFHREKFGKYILLYIFTFILSVKFAPPLQKLTYPRNFVKSFHASREDVL